MFDSAATQCGSHFISFQKISPPLMLVPNGELAAFHQEALQNAIQTHPVQVAQQKHEGSAYVVTCKGGGTVRIRRMHSERSN